MAVLLLLLLFPLAFAQSPIDVMTRSGPVRGFRRAVLGKDVDHFLGIPFAQPPVGALRFKAPQPVTPWKKVRNATSLSPTCWQYVPTALERNNGGAGVWVNNTVMSEDCLYLNVWAPKIGGPPKAVMVWIFGGGFMTGSANLQIYNGAYLAAEEGIIVASLQYRVSLFGFLHLDPSPSSCNAGLQDQRLAMKWIADNAKAFNGDPSRITITGESAGAASVSMHLLSPGSHRLYHRAVLHSGSFLSPWAFVAPSLLRQRSRRLATGVGCLTSNAAAAKGVSDATVFKCLQGVSAGQLNAKVVSAIDGEQAPRLEAVRAKLGYAKAPSPLQLLYDFSFGPTPAPPFFPVNQTEAMRRATLSPVPLLTGTNVNEATYFLLYYIPVLSNALFGSPQRLPDWPSDLSAFQLTPSRVTELIGRHVLPQELLSPALISLLALWYDFPAPQVTMTAGQRAQQTLTALDRLTGDYNFKCPLYNLAKWYAAQKQPVYMYGFAHRTSLLPMPAWMGVMHGYELDYLFGMPLSSKFTQTFYNYTAGERLLARDIMRRWSNFVKTGNPNKGEGSASEKISWPTFNETSPSVLRLAADASQLLLQVTQEGGQRIKDCRFWELAVEQLKSKEKSPAAVSKTGQINSSSSLVPLSSALLLLVSTALLAALSKL